MRPFPNKPSYSCPTEGVVQIGTSEGMYLMVDEEEVDVFVWDEKIALPELDDSDILSLGDISQLYVCDSQKFISRFLFDQLCYEFSGFGETLIESMKLK